MRIYALREEIKTIARNHLGTRFLEYISTLLWRFHVPSPVMILTNIFVILKKKIQLKRGDGASNNQSIFGTTSMRNFSFSFQKSAPKNLTYFLAIHNQFWYRSIWALQEKQNPYLNVSFVLMAGPFLCHTFSHFLEICHSHLMSS